MALHAQAAQAFEAWRQVHGGQLPRLADPQAAPLIRMLADADRFLPAQGRGDLPSISDACDRAQAAIVAYMVPAEAKEGAGLSAAAMVESAAASQDELALLQPFMARCVAHQIPLAEATLRQLDARTVAQLRLGGVRRGQVAIQQLYASLATALSDPRFQPAYADALLDALAQVAPVHARALGVQDRAMPRDLAAAQAARPGHHQAEWQRIAAAMGDPRCEALCALASHGGR